jgi:hypothetical protein
MAADVLPDRHPGTDPLSLYLEITALHPATLPQLPPNNS